MNRALTFLAAIAATTLAVSAACFAAVSPLISYTIEKSGQADHVQLRLDGRFEGNHNSNWSEPFWLNELHGLTTAQLRSPARVPVQFAIVREAGRIDCSGTAGDGRGRGNCGFKPDASFAALLSSRGIARPGLADSYALTMGNVGRSLLDALAAANYPRPTVSQLVALGIHRVSPAYIGAIANAGYRLGSVGELVGFKIHQVSPELIRAYREFGYRRLSADDLMAMSIHRVTPEFIRGFASLAYRDLPANKLIQLRIFNVTPADVRILQAQGIARPSADQLVRLRLAGTIPKHRGQ